MTSKAFSWMHIQIHRDRRPSKSSDCNQYLGMPHSVEYHRVAVFYLKVCQNILQQSRGSFGRKHALAQFL